MTDISPISPETLRDLLGDVLIRELRVWRDSFASEQMRAFDLGCFPWHGYLEVSFLTVDEPTMNANEDPFTRIAEWRLYNFGVRSPAPIRIAREHLGYRMRKRWTIEGSKSEISERFLATAVAVGASQELQAELAHYNRTAEFVTTVFDPDHPSRGNLVVTGAS